MDAQPSSGHLDLHSRALAALNHLTGNLDPKLGYEPYFWTIFDEEPVEARHDFCDFGDDTGRYLDSLILIRRMTGAEDGATEEAGLKELLVSYFSEGDGLSYRPATPWSHHDVLLHDQSRVLTALTTWLQADGSPQAELRLRQHIDGLLRIAIREDGLARYPWESYPPHGWDPNYWPGEPFGIRPGEAPYEGGVHISPLVRAYELLGYEPALELARGLAAWNRSFGGVAQEDGSFWVGHPRLTTIAGIARLAQVVGDEDLLAWGRRAYDLARAQGTRFGWLPEKQHHFITCETCAITDLIEAGLLFAEGGQSECFGHVERMARNHLAESQLLDASGVPAWAPFRSSGGRPDTLQSSFDRVRERVQGGFAGFSGPNDWRGRTDFLGYRMMNCCSPRGARALYFVWAHAVRREGRVIQVNLWLDRNAPWALVRSALPQEGRLQVLLREDADLRVRIPDGVAPEQIASTVDRAAKAPTIDGSYLRFEGLRSGQTVEIRVPLGEYETTEHADGHEYRVGWRGDTVVSIDPPGTQIPLYRRHVKAPGSSPAPLEGSPEPARAFVWW